MSPFLIFALILTVLYITYYAVIITQDVYRKKDQQNTDEVESFDVSQMSDDESIAVTENGDGFTLTKLRDKLHDITVLPNQETKPKEPVKARKPENMAPVDSDLPNEMTDEENNMKLTFFDSLNEISPEYSVQLEKKEFRTALLTKGKLNNLIKIKENRNEI